MAKQVWKAGNMVYPLPAGTAAADACWIGGLRFRRRRNTSSGGTRTTTWPITAEQRVEKGESYHGASIEAVELWRHSTRESQAEVP